MPRKKKIKRKKRIKPVVSVIIKPVGSYEEYIEIYNMVLSESYFIERDYKSLTGRRSFDIANYWTTEYKNNEALFQILNTALYPIIRPLHLSFTKAKNKYLKT